MTKFGGRRENDLQHLVRTSTVNEDGVTVAHAIPSAGMRFGGRDETREHQVVTRIDHLDGRLPEHIQESLAPRIAEHSRISLKTDRVPFLYYQRIAFGRLCSCWTSSEAGPDKKCPVCYGNGFVNGFHKYGCEWHVIDMTHPDLGLVNVVPDHESGKRPIPLTLLKTAGRGHIEATIQLSPNTGVLDAMQLGAYQPKGSRVTLYVRTSDEASFTEVTGIAQVQDRLLDANGNPTTLTFKIDLRRANPDAPLPTFTWLHLRYRQRARITMFADMSPQPETIELQEHGLTDNFDTIDFVVDRSLPNIQTSDMFIRADGDPLRDGQRLKAISVTRWTPLGVLVETVVRARHINQDERYHFVL